MPGVWVPHTCVCLLMPCDCQVYGSHILVYASRCPVYARCMCSTYLCMPLDALCIPAVPLDAVCMLGVWVPHTGVCLLTPLYARCMPGVWVSHTCEKKELHPHDSNLQPCSHESSSLTTLPCGWPTKEHGGAMPCISVLRHAGEAMIIF